MVPLKIFPLLVLGSLSTIKQLLKEATGPISFLTIAMHSFSKVLASVLPETLATTKPTGISPLKSSIYATTAASTILGCLRSASSIAAVDSL